jgi:hypothetical protein
MLNHPCVTEGRDGWSDGAVPAVPVEVVEVELVDEPPPVEDVVDASPEVEVAVTSEERDDVAEGAPGLCAAMVALSLVVESVVAAGLWLSKD